MQLSIVIVSYNTKDFLKKCLASIFENTSLQLTYEVIIVDNASTDGTIVEITNLFRLAKAEKNKYIPPLKLIKNSYNLGFSKANNIGVSEARGEFILFLNSDTLVYKHTIDKLVQFMEHHNDAGAATCFVELSDGTLDDASHRGFPTPWNALCHFSGISKLFSHSMFLNGYNLAWKNLDKVHEIDALAGACMIVRRKAGDTVGWWDEDYFFYGEDIDFCYKLKEKHWKIYFLPSVKILHYKGVSSGIKGISKNITTADKHTKKKITQARFDAMRLFYKKHYLEKYPHILTTVILHGIQLKQAFTMIKDH